MSKNGLFVLSVGEIKCGVFVAKFMTFPSIDAV